MFDMFGGGFKANKLKPQLKMAVHRFQMSSNKKSALLKQNMREVAVLLAEDPPKEEKARIKAESLIRDDYMIEAFDILSLNCDLLSERIKLIEFSKECPADLISCVSTLMYAAPRVDIPELAKIKKQLTAKFGKQFAENAMGNVGGVLNERVVTKLSVQPPAAYLVQTYLEQICEKYEVDWSPTHRLSADQMGEPMAPPSGYSVPIGTGTGLGNKLIAHTGMTVNGDEDDHPDDGQYFPPPMAPGGGGGSSNGHNNKDDFNRPDYQLPTAPGGGGSSSGHNNKDDFNRTDFQLPTAPGGGGSSSGHNNKDDFNQPDFQLPTAPAASTPKTSVNSNDSTTIGGPPITPLAPPPASNLNTTTNKNDDDEDDNSKGNGKNQPSSSSGGKDTASYSDLAARFENLKNL